MRQVVERIVAGLNGLIQLHAMSSGDMSSAFRAFSTAT